jgi:hydrogenase maturation factor
VFAETRVLCDVLGLDPLGIIASGSMLIAVAPEDADDVCAAVRSVGVPVTVIARAVSGPPSVVIAGSQEAQPLPRFDQDELTRLF